MGQERRRIRGRFGVAAGVAPGVLPGLTLATGGDDPVSANQTLDDGFSRKALGVDRAFRWAATDALTFMGGKMPNPFFRPGDHHPIYDDDLNPEGLAAGWEKGGRFARYAGFRVEERGAAHDSIMLGGEVGRRRALANGVRVTLGTSYYDYLETQGQAPFWDGAPAGNRVDSAGNYSSDFNIAELFGEVGFELRGRPLALFADYVVNTEADVADRGFALGASFGEVAGPRRWRVGYRLSGPRGRRRRRHVYGLRRRHRREAARRQPQLRLAGSARARPALFRERARRRGRSGARLRPFCRPT